MMHKVELSGEENSALVISVEIKQEDEELV